MHCLHKLNSLLLFACRNKNALSVLESEKAQAQLNRERSKVTADWGCCLDQIKWDVDHQVWDLIDDLDEIKSTVSKFERHLENFYKTSSDLKLYFGTPLPTELRIAYDAAFQALVAKISAGKERLLFVKKQIAGAAQNERAHAEQVRCEREKLSEQKKTNELLVCARSLLSELNTRDNILHGKCSINFDELSDFEILELKKKEECMHVELRELLDKASNLETFVMPCGREAQTLRDKVAHIRTEAGKDFNLYLQNLREVVACRDISEEKLKNSASFKIDMKKFHSYGSDLDI